MTYPALRTRGLGIHFGGIRAVDNVSVEIAHGGVTSIIGPNGAGKSTFFNLLSGALKPLSGTVQLDGEDVTGLRADQLQRKGLSRSFQITNLFRDLAVYENLRLAASALETRLGGLRLMRQCKLANERACEMLERFELEHRAATPAGYLSHGEQRRLEIAMALAGRPRILLLDEPTQGMSHSDTEDSKELIRSIGQEITVVLIEHDIDLVMDLSREVIVLQQGALLAQGSPQTIRADKRVQAAYLGEA